MNCKHITLLRVTVTFLVYSNVITSIDILLRYMRRMEVRPTTCSLELGHKPTLRFRSKWIEVLVR